MCLNNNLWSKISYDSIEKITITGDQLKTKIFNLSGALTFKAILVYKQAWTTLLKETPLPHVPARGNLF